MELRKDPITRSWVVVGHAEAPEATEGPCPLCPGNEQEMGTIAQLPAGGPWEVRVFPHIRPLYRIEGDPGRVADGIYDRMSGIGAHEIVVDSREHGVALSDEPDEQIAQVLEMCARRVEDLKRDARFKYVTLSKNLGKDAGQEWPHSHLQITATTFVPRRVLYELRAAREWFRERERCVFCDILRQEEKQGVRMVDAHGDYLAFCPYAARVPFETWILPRRHNHEFETPGAENFLQVAALLGRVLRRLRTVAQGYHLVVHTSPSAHQTKGELSEYWKTIADDYHWHIEVLPIVPAGAKSYVIKEVYFNGLMPERAAEVLRQANPGR